MYSIKIMLDSAYGLNECIVTSIERGTMNQCYRVESGRSVYFLKSYATRFYNLDKIRQSCEVQMLVHRAGLPTPNIIFNDRARSVTETNEGIYVLSEFADGHEYAQTEAPYETAYHMGAMLASLQSHLKILGSAAPITLPNPTTATANLQRLLNCAEVRRGQSKVDAIAYHLLQYKIEALNRNTTLFTRIKDIPAQWVHGDYQISNLIFNDEGQVRAILDFDQLQRRPRGLEMMRALDFSFSTDQILERPGLSFFRGYASKASLGEAEVRLLAPLWTYYWLLRPWPLDVRYESPEDYDVRWDALIQPPNAWWEQNMTVVTERYLEMLKTSPATQLG